jgi:hypothetical protein
MERDPDLFDESFTQMSRALGQSVTNKDWLQSWIDEGKALQQAKREYHAKLQTMLDETKPEHVPRKKAALQADFAKVIEDHRAQYVDKLQPQIDQLKRSAKPKETPADFQQVLRYLQLKEIRDEIKTKGQDPILLRADYEARCQDTTGAWDDWLSAIESAPVPLLPGEVLDRGRESRALRDLDPKHRQQLSDLEQLREGTTYLLTLASRELPEREEVAEMAQGTPPDEAA